MIIILVRDVTARLVGTSVNSFKDVWRSERDGPEFIKVDFPVVAGDFGLGHIRMQGYIDRYAAIERHRWEVLVEEGLEHDDLVSLFEERHKNGVLT